VLKRSVKNILLIGGSSLLLLVMIGFTNVKNSSRPIHDVVISIEQKEGNFFIDKPEVLSLLNAENTDYVLGLPIGEVDLKLLESRLEAHAFVEDAQVAYDLRGNLLVSIDQSKPIARIYNSKGSDQYINFDGKILPFNTKHTARVPILEIEKKVSWTENLNDTEEGTRLYQLLSHIEQDEFWKAQIAHLILKKNGDIEMIPQVTKQKIVFGAPEDIEDKFQRLKLFYTDILPNKGWNTYAVVNLKFKNQIVCK